MGIQAEGSITLIAVLADASCAMLLRRLRKSYNCAVWLAVISFFVATMSTLSGCDGGEHSESSRAKTTLTPFEHALLDGTVEPLVDGNAYLIGTTAIYFLDHGAAAKVEGISVDVSATVTPLSDGSAIYIDQSAKPPKAFILQRNKARPIEEGAWEDAGSTSPKEKDIAAFYFVQATRAARAARAASDQDSSFDPSDYDNHDGW